MIRVHELRHTLFVRGPRGTHRVDDEVAEERAIAQNSHRQTHTWQYLRTEVVFVGSESDVCLACREVRGGRQRVAQVVRAHEPAEHAVRMIAPDADRQVFGHLELLAKVGAIAA